MRPVVAVDLGGTSIRAAFYPQGAPPATRLAYRRTPAASGITPVLEAIHRAIADLDLPTDLQPSMAIGIGAPGPLDAMRGIVLHAPNLTGWDDVPLVDRLVERWGCPVFLQNDANLAALGEWRFGAGRGAHNLVMLTLGTGIGGGVIVHDRLLAGDRGLAGELGHIPILKDGPVCSCGRPGHLEAVASGPAIARAYRSRRELPGEHFPAVPEEPTAEWVAHAAAAGDAHAAAVFHDAAAALGTALAGLVHIFNPERIVLGGGVSQAGATFLAEIERSLRGSLMHPAFGDGLSVVVSELGDEAALLGAVAWVNDHA